tara:strand:+ start:39 stop:1043 length:1005 start_codon:yes stop_codon:yes gene_type:complete
MKTTLKKQNRATAKGKVASVGESMSKQTAELKKRGNKLAESSIKSLFTSKEFVGFEMEMSPDVAKLILLETNCNTGEDATNRTLKKRNVNFLARAIEEGSWKRHAGSVKFDTNGTLIDGQHRLTAIAQSGEILPIIVELGCDVGTAPAIDQGDNRTLTHAVQFGGELDKMSPSLIGWFTTRAVQILRSMVNVEGNPVQEGTLSERSKGYSAKQVVKVIKDNFAALKWLHTNRSKKKGFARPAIIGPITQLITSDEKVGKAFYNDFIGASLKKAKSNAPRMLAKHLEKVNQMKADGEEMSLRVYSSRGYDEMVYWHQKTLKAIEAFKEGRNIKFK